MKNIEEIEKYLKERVDLSGWNDDLHLLDELIKIHKDAEAVVALTEERREGNEISLDGRIDQDGSIALSLYGLSNDDIPTACGIMALSMIQILKERGK